MLKPANWHTLFTPPGSSCFLVCGGLLASRVALNSSQIDNVQRLMERSGQTPASGSIRERTLVKLESTIEEALAGIRTELSNMEQVVEQLKELLFQADVFLSDPANALQYAGNPTEALNHVSMLYDSYQAELLEKREVRFCFLLNLQLGQSSSWKRPSTKIMADYTAEEISAEQFAQAWKVMQEVQSAQDMEMDALLSGMNNWTSDANGSAMQS